MALKKKKKVLWGALKLMPRCTRCHDVQMHFNPREADIKLAQIKKKKKKKAVGRIIEYKNMPPITF